MPGKHLTLEEQIVAEIPDAERLLDENKKLKKPLTLEEFYNTHHPKAKAAQAEKERQAQREKEQLESGEPRTLAEAKQMIANLRAQAHSMAEAKAAPLVREAVAKEEKAHDETKAELVRVKHQLATFEEQKDREMADARRAVVIANAERDAIADEKTKLEKSVVMLERLAGVRGINPRDAVASLDSPAERVSVASFDARYNAAKSDAERQAIVAELENASAAGRLA